MGKLRDILYLDENVQAGGLVDPHMILSLEALSNSQLHSISSCHGHAKPDQGWYSATEYPYIIFEARSNTYKILKRLTSIFNLLSLPDEKVDLDPQSTQNHGAYRLSFGLHRTDTPTELKLARSQLDLYKFWALLNILDESTELNTLEELRRLHLSWARDTLESHYNETVLSIKQRKIELPTLLSEYHLLLKETQTTKQNLHHSFE